MERLHLRSQRPWSHRRGHARPGCALTAFLPNFLREELPLPEVSEIEVVRHYVHLSQKNYSVDNGFYPLGSCTMKYNPKVNERSGPPARLLPTFIPCRILRPCRVRCN